MISRKLLLMLFALALPLVVSAQTQWALDKCTLTYHVDHPLHHVG